MPHIPIPVECTGEREHEEETSALEDLGRLLSDVRAFARRGRQEVTRMLEQLSNTAEQVGGCSMPGCSTSVPMCQAHHAEACPPAALLKLCSNLLWARVHACLEWDAGPAVSLTQAGARAQGAGRAAADAGVCMVAAC
jgi:hypothetical protein